MPAAQEDYTVQIEAFEGPLDLLLFLIRRAEVDIQDIQIAEITDQYLLALGQVDDVDVELAGEFLVMAATLIELKSRTLAPVESTEEAGEGDAGDALSDPKQDLIRQLLAYQRIRMAAEDLDERRLQFQMRNRVRIRPSDEALRVDEQDGLDLDDVHLMDLSDAYERIASAIDFDMLGSHHVSVDDVPIALYQEDLMDRLNRRAGEPLQLQDAFAGKGPAQRVGLFLGLLELVRERRVTCCQEMWGEPIVVELKSTSDDDDDEVDEQVD